MRRSLPKLPPYFQSTIDPFNIPPDLARAWCCSCGVCGGVVNNVGHTFCRLHSCQASRTSARSSTTHQLPSPTAPAYPPIASPSNANMPLLGRKFPAQIGTSDRAARRSEIEGVQQLTDTQLQPSPCGPSTSPVRREHPSRIREEEEIEKRIPAAIRMQLDGAKCW